MSKNKSIEETFKTVVAVGVVGAEESLELLLPINGCYLRAPGWDAVSLITGSYNSHSGIPLEDCADIKWVIYPGNKCEVSDDGLVWKPTLYIGFSGKTEYPIENIAGDAWKYIRPVKTDPKLNKLQNTINETQATLKKLQEELKEYKESK